MDRESVYSLSVFNTTAEQERDSRAALQQRLMNFILEFQLDNIFIYRYGFEKVSGLQNADIL